MKQPVMVGTRFDTMGGISSVVNVYRAAGFFDRFNVRYIASHCDGGALAKLCLMMTAVGEFLFLLIRKRVSLVHVHMSSRASFWRKSIFLLLAGVFRVPRIIHLHGSEFAIFYEKECSPFARWFVRFVFDSSDRVIVLSDTWKNWVSNISKNKAVLCVYNPVELPDGQSVRVEENAALLFMGRLGRRKGTYDLVNAVSRLDKPYSLILAGDGDVDEIRALAEGLGISEKVEITGWVRGAEKDALFKRACLYVLPSYNEGLPMGILEAMAQGLPIVSTPIGGIPEAVREGIEGFLVQPGDVESLAKVLDDLISDRMLRVRTGHAARSRVEAVFSVDRILPTVMQVYGDLGAGQ